MKKKTEKPISPAEQLQAEYKKLDELILESFRDSRGAPYPGFYLFVYLQLRTITRLTKRTSFERIINDRIKKLRSDGKIVYLKKKAEAQNGRPGWHLAKTEADE
jgi:hypothetical protein